MTLPCCSGLTTDLSIAASHLCAKLNYGDNGKVEDEPQYRPGWSADMCVTVKVSVCMCVCVCVCVCVRVCV